MENVKSLIITLALISSITIVKSQYITAGGDTSFSLGTIQYGEPNEYKEDTVKIIMMACDTAVNGWQNTAYYLNPFARAEQQHHSINWIYGYAVRKITIEKKGNHRSGMYMWYNTKDEYSYLIKQFLDDEKKPLKNTIIWQTIDL